MKALFCTLLGCWLLSSSSAQDTTVALSRFELFISQKGRTFKIETQELGMAGNRTGLLYKATDLVNGESRKAVRLGYPDYMSQPLLTDQRTMWIDQEELDTVVDVLSRFVQIASSSQPNRLVQYSYITSNDIAFTCAYDPFNSNWQYSMGKLYKMLRFCVPRTVSTFNRKRFADWVDMLRRARTLPW